MEDKGVEKVAVNYFDELFHTISPSEFEGFLDEITLCITHQMNQRLIRMATNDEVRQASFMMHPEKVHGPNGMITFFLALLPYY